MVEGDELLKCAALSRTVGNLVISLACHRYSLSPIFPGSSGLHLAVKSATRSFEAGGPLWFDTDAIIDGATNALFAAEITLGGLHRDMSEQELNLLQLSSCGVAELRA